jgi:hypothetical protein
LSIRLWNRTSRSGAPTADFPHRRPGVIFGFAEVDKIDAAGNFSVLDRFTGGRDGSQPEAGLVLDAAANLYAATTAETGHILPSDQALSSEIDTLGNYRVLYRPSRLPFRDLL